MTGVTDAQDAADIGYDKPRVALNVGESTDQVAFEVKGNQGRLLAVHGTGWGVTAIDPGEEVIRVREGAGRGYRRSVTGPEIRCMWKLSWKARTNLSFVRQLSHGRRQDRQRANAGDTNTRRGKQRDSWRCVYSLRGG